MRCRACGHVSWPPRLLCPQCASARADPVPAGGGIVRELTQTRTPAGEPVAIVSVVLDAGPWVIAQARAATPGDRVKLLLADDGAVEAVG